VSKAPCRDNSTKFAERATSPSKRTNAIREPLEQGTNVHSADVIRSRSNTKVYKKIMNFLTNRPNMTLNFITIGIMHINKFIMGLP
jgi:hypothetical protein